MNETTDQKTSRPLTRDSLSLLARTIMECLSEMNTTYHRAKDPMRMFDTEDENFRTSREQAMEICIEIWTRDERRCAIDR